MVYKYNLTFFLVCVCVGILGLISPKCLVSDHVYRWYHYVWGKDRLRVPFLEEVCYFS